MTEQRTAYAIERPSLTRQTLVLERQRALLTVSALYEALGRAHLLAKDALQHADRLASYRERIRAVWELEDRCEVAEAEVARLTLALVEARS